MTKPKSDKEKPEKLYALTKGVNANIIPKSDHTNKQLDILLLGNIKGWFGYDVEYISKAAGNEWERFMWFVSSCKKSNFYIVAPRYVIDYFEYLIKIVKNRYNIKAKIKKICVSNEYSYDDAFKILEKMRFDICLMNPPYMKSQPGDGFYVEFLNNVCKISGKIISVNPDPAIIGHQSGSIAKNQFKAFRKFMDEHYIEIDAVDPSIFEDAGIKSGLCIVNIDNNKSHNIIYNKFGVIKSFNTQKEINDYFDNKYLVEFDNKIRKYFNNGNDCLENHIKLTKGYGDFSKIKYKESNPDTSLLYIYLLKPNAAYAYAAYTDVNDNRSKVAEYNEEDQKRGAAYITFSRNEREQANNALNYIQSDFVHMCVKFSSISNIGGVNRYTIVPWLNFSKKYTEDDLFNLIGMNYDKKEVNKILDK